MNRIRELRALNKWRQEDLAERLNTVKSVVSRYETEQLGIDADTINALCDIFGVSADYLLCRSVAPNATLSDEDAALLRAYHAASLRDRGLVDQILQAYAEPAAVQKTEGVSAG